MSDDKIMNMGVVDIHSREEKAWTFTLAANYQSLVVLDEAGQQVAKVRADDAYDCLTAVRKLLEAEGLIPMCQGARPSVHPSGMSAQMSSGMSAYELKPGRQASMDDLVNVFDPAEADQVGTLAEQEAFFSQPEEKPPRYESYPAPPAMVTADPRVVVGAESTAPPETTTS